MSSELLTVISGLLAAITTVLGIWARKTRVRVKAAETRQVHYEQLESERDQQYKEVVTEVKRLRDDKLAVMQDRLDDVEADNIKLRNGLDAMEAARNRDLETHEADRRQWNSDKARLEGELGQLRTDLSAAQARIRELEIGKVRLEEQNKALVANNELLSGMVAQWNVALPEFVKLAKAIQKADPATMGQQ